MPQTNGAVVVAAAVSIGVLVGPTVVVHAAASLALSIILILPVASSSSQMLVRAAQSAVAELPADAVAG